MVSLQLSLGSAVAQWLEVVSLQLSLGNVVAQWLEVVSLQLSLGSAVAQWLERQALNRENPNLNPPAAILKLRQFRSSRVATVHSAV